MFQYSFAGETHSDLSDDYLDQLGVSPEWKDTLKRQAVFEQQQILDRRREAYRRESDPLFMEWQFDQTPEREQLWRARVALIKERYPLS